MNWIKDYQLFLFDFDGLLVNTEQLHFEAYRRVCRERGVDLNWDFSTFSRYAHHSATKLQETLTTLYPQIGPWEALYAAKKKSYLGLISSVELMPGVEEMLALVGDVKVVVTHSPQEQIDTIKKQHKSLQTIPHWITREHYQKPKPDPECYQKAIARYLPAGGRAIGFEDTPRGIHALLGTEATPLLISSVHRVEGVQRFDSMREALGSHTIPA